MERDAADIEDEAADVDAENVDEDADSYAVPVKTGTDMSAELLDTETAGISQALPWI